MRKRNAHLSRNNSEERSTLISCWNKKMKILEIVHLLPKNTKNQVNNCWRNKTICSNSTRFIPKQLPRKISMLSKKSRWMPSCKNWRRKLPRKVLLLVLKALVKLLQWTEEAQLQMRIKWLIIVQRIVVLLIKRQTM